MTRYGKRQPFYFMRYVHKVNGKWVCRSCGKRTTPPVDEYFNGYHRHPTDYKKCEKRLRG